MIKCMTLKMSYYKTNYLESVALLSLAFELRYMIHSYVLYIHTRKTIQSYYGDLCQV